MLHLYHKLIDKKYIKIIIILESSLSKKTRRHTLNTQTHFLTCSEVRNKMNLRGSFPTSLKGLPSWEMLIAQ